MPDWPSDVSDAVLICTRNRPGELAKTLRSVAGQSGAANRPVLVVDGSDPNEATQTAGAVGNERAKDLPFYYHDYSGDPAAPRQRNAGIDLLPSSVRVVHFIDDDVRLRPGYFESLMGAFERHPDVLGVGGIVEEPGSASPRPEISWMHRLFLLRTDTPSRVLPSGQTTPAWPLRDRALQPADWLSTCASSYRRRVFDTHRFDPEATGRSPRLEDLDFSVRVRREGPLAVVPRARCVHYFSPQNRRNVEDAVRERTVRRYWFVRKNMDHPMNRAAFWWSLVGRLLAAASSSNTDRRAALAGLLRGIRTVLSRDHPLLSS